MKILVASNDEIAVPFISALRPSAVLTVKGKESGRKTRINPVKAWAEENGVKCYEVEHLKTAEREEIAKGEYDRLVSFSFSRIFGPKFLALFKSGAFNIHPSALPLLRGPSPIQTAILEGRSDTEVVVQTISLKMDEGDIVMREKVHIDSKDDYFSLSKKIGTVAVSFAPLLLKDSASLTYEKQNGKATYTRLFTKEDGHVSFESGEIAERQVRAFSLFPKAYAFWNGKMVQILKSSFEKAVVTGKNGTIEAYEKGRGFKVACSDGYLYIERLKLEGKGECDAASFYNGHKEFVNAHLT